jgi:hypothetical protein
LACPEPALSNGLGTSIPRPAACADAGYLCQGSRAFQIRRWPLERGWLRIRIPPPPIEDGGERRRLLEAAVAGVMEWNGHPFPLRIDSGRFPRRPWDVELYWVPLAQFGAGSQNAGVTAVTWSEQGGEPRFSVGSISTVLYDTDGRGAQVTAPSLLVSQVAAHEMGHALGLLHSDRATDIMTPGIGALRGVSPRDLQTVAALYRLPNGAMVAGG